MNTEPTLRLNPSTRIAWAGHTDAALQKPLEDFLCTRLPGVVVMGQAEQRAELVVHCVTPVTLTDEWANRFAAPPTIHPYPDYADHINLRFVKHEGSTHAFVLAGAERAFWHGLGLLMEQMGFDGEVVTLSCVDRDWQPHTPVRGVRFLDPPKDTEALSFHHALWGDSVTSLPAGQTPLVSFGQSGSAPINWVSIMQPDDVKTLRLDSSREVWADVSLLDELQLDHIIDDLPPPDACPIKAMIYGPHDAHLDLLRVLLPFHVQLITITSLDTPLETIAETYALRAPMTYGVIGLATAETPSWKRYAWCSLSGSPQPTLDESLHRFAQWYVGSEAAPLLVEAIRLSESDEGACVGRLEVVRGCVPEALQATARVVLNEVETYNRRREP